MIWRCWNQLVLVWLNSLALCRSKTNYWILFQQELNLLESVANNFDMRIGHSTQQMEYQVVSTSIELYFDRTLNVLEDLVFIINEWNHFNNLLTSQILYLRASSYINLVNSILGAEAKREGLSNCLSNFYVWYQSHGSKSWYRTLTRQVPKHNDLNILDRNWVIHKKF